MDGHQRVYWDEIRTVQSLIEQCLQKYMTQVIWNTVSKYPALMCVMCSSLWLRVST